MRFTGRVGGRELSPFRAESAQLLTTSVEMCEVGDRLELDLGPFGVAVGSVERVEGSPRRPLRPYALLARLWSRLRVRLGGSR